MRKSSVSKQSKHSSSSASRQRRAARRRRRANFLCQRATSGAPSAMRRAVACASARDLIVGHDARHQPLVLRLARHRRRGPRAESRARPLRPTSRTSGADLGVRHHQAEVLDRRAEAARRAADAQIAQRRDLEPAADADAVDLRHQRMPAIGERLGGRVHVCAVVDRLRLVGALGGELGDVVAGRERLVARAAEHDAAQRVVGREPARPFRRARCHIGARQRVQLVGAIQHDGGDGAVAVDSIRIVSSCHDVIGRRTRPARAPTTGT